MVILGGIFKIYYGNCSIQMCWKINKKTAPQKMISLKMTQFAANSNIATTKHKLQGQKNNIYLLGHGISDVKIGYMLFYYQG